MNRNGTQLGRPPYTREQRIEASKKRFLKGLTVDPATGHWTQERDDFPLPDGRRVRKRKFAYIMAHPQLTDNTDWWVHVLCDFGDCVNPAHLRYTDKQAGTVSLSTPAGEVDDSKLIAMLRMPTLSDLTKKHVLLALKRFWREHPIDENDPAVDARMEFFPEALPYEDADAMRALAAEYGITVS